MQSLAHNTPVILTSCTFQFLPIDHPWKPGCKRREGSEERTGREIYIVCSLSEIFFLCLSVQETPLPSAEGRNALLCLRCWLGLLFKDLSIQWVLILSLLLPSGSKARHRDKTVNTSRSAMRLCISETPFDAFWKQIACCLPALEVGQKPYLHFIKEETESWKSFAWDHRLSHWHSKKQTAGLVASLGK